MKKNIENSIKDSLNDLELPYNSNAWDSLSAKLDAGAAPSGDSGSPVDNAIKSSLENYELPYAAAAWTAMNAKLDAKDAPRSYIRWYLAASILFATMAVSYLAITNSHEEQKSSTPSSEITQNETPKITNYKSNTSSTSDEPEVNSNGNTPSDIVTSVNIGTAANGGQPLTGNEPVIPLDINTPNNGGPDPVIVNQGGGSNVVYPIEAQVSTPAVTFILPLVDNVCQGESIKIANENKYPISIIFPNGSVWSARGRSETKLTTAVAGIYVIGYMEDGQLQEEGSFNVNSSPTSDFDFVNLDKILLDGLPTTEVSSISSGINHEWKFDEQTTNGSEAAAHFFTKGNHDIELTVTGSNGCKSSITKQVNIKDNYNLLAVNAFDPRSLDARNNRFIPIALVERIGVKFSMIIVDHTDGHIMYETSDASQGWDGIDRATGEQLGYQKTFIWKVSIENPKAGENSVYGSSAIILPRQN
ncbi:hypothetical protein N8Z27_00640 [Crocinitomicaceae bacterium]|nr:hypothetical protein [Crocinitomicaceae bacterium]MDC0100533.1 hypothetical protein [Crocinitomicaceae bacterium]MDC1282666.1 hypothetical protein [Crocinitomicaceae bacterium]MDC1384585.1 hypothetical protein [Crocinitomicaceae bacterium]